MKVSLPTISAINIGSLSSEIESSSDTTSGDIVFNYKISLTAITNELLNNDAVSMKVSLLPQPSKSPTNDFKKISSGDLSPVMSLSGRGFSSLQERSGQSSESKSSSSNSFSGGLTTSDSKKVNFSKNTTVAKSILKSHIQLKQSISENSENESLQEIASETKSIDSFMSDLAKKELTRSKMLNSIQSGTGDTISTSSTVSEVFFDGGVKFTLQSRRASRSNEKGSDLSLPTLDTLLVQRTSPSTTTNIGDSSVEYEVDPTTGEVVAKSGVSNISQSTSQDPLMGMLERSGKVSTGVSSIESDPQVAAWSAISKHGVAPSQIVAMSMSDFINTARDNYEGVSRSLGSKKTDSQVKTSKYDDLNQISSSLRRKFLKTPTISPEKISDISSRSSITVASETTTENTSFEYSFQVPSSKLSSNKFFIAIDLIDSNGRTIQSETKTIDHRKNVNQFYTVTKPPVLTAVKSEDSMTHIMVKQVDKYANKIILLKRHLSNSRLSQGSSFEKIDEFYISQKDPVTLKSFVIAPGSPAIIRAVSVSKSGEAGTFSDIIVKAQRSNIDTPISDEIVEVSMNSKNSNKGILVESKILSGSPVALYFLRKNLTRRDRTYSPLSSTNTGETASRGKVYQLLDNTAIDGNTYEYRCKVILKSGAERISESCTIQKRQIIRDSISVNSNPPSVRRSKASGEYQITIDASMNIPQSDADTTKAMFDDLGLSELFSEEISEIKDQFSSIAVFRVKRFDVNSGIEYDLGIKTSGNFEDSGDSSRGVPAPKSDSEYIYRLEPLLRTTTGILSEIKTTQPLRNLKESQSIPSLSVEKSTSLGSSTVDTNFPEKFTSPLAIKAGTISYGAALAGNHADNSFELGSTGIVKSINVSTPVSTISVSKTSVKTISTGDVQVRWSISGNLDKIDHFIISANRDGTIVPIGTHHAHSNKKSFIFTDTSQKGILGDVEYSITPVLSDLTQGKSKTAGSVSIIGEF